MNRLHIDFETFGTVDLRRCGGYRYASHRDTKIVVVCWAMNEEEVYTWVPGVSEAEARAHGLPINEFWFYGPRVPAKLVEHVRKADRVLAHNATFERAVWQAIVVRRYGGPRIAREKFECTAARAAASGLPRSLEGVGMALEGPQQKDTEGKRLVKLFCMPRKPTKKDPRIRVMPLEEVQDFKGLCAYCAQDVRTERHVDKTIPSLHPSEQELFTFDMEVNERGLLIDIPLVKKTQNVVAKLEAKIVAEVVHLTKCEKYPDGLRPTQRDKMLDFFHSIGVNLENMQADHVRKYMRDNVDSLTALGRRLLLLRMEAGKASTKKLASMLAYCGADHRARGTLLFYGAHTGRWSGKGIQPHNFIRGRLKFPEQLEIFKLLQLADPIIFDILYEWPITAISSCMRGFILPSPGKVLRVVDYSSIEARVLAWLAGEEWVLKAYIEGLDVYILMASGVFNKRYEDIGKDSEERRIGKNLVLGCGYGLGAAKFVAYSEKAGTEITEKFAKEAVKAYRTKHPKIIRFWYDVEQHAISAVQRKATREAPVRLRNLAFFVEQQWLCVKLPSGRCLRYYRPKVVPVEKFGQPSLQLQYKVEFRGRLYSESTYGGKMVENIVQAVARDILVSGMLAAERSGYRVIGTVHDEILTEQTPEEGSVKQLEAIVCALPKWANGLPIAAEGFESPRYRKG